MTLFVTYVIRCTPMRALMSIAIFFIFFLNPLSLVRSAENTKPIIIGVIDSAIDAEHPLIMPYLYRCEGCSPDEQAVFDELAKINEAEIIRQKQDLKIEEKGNAAGALNALFDQLGFTDQEKIPSRKIPIFSTLKATKKAFDMELSGKADLQRKIGFMLHGTHVSSLATAGLDPRNFKLLFIPFPKSIVDVSGKRTLEQVQNDVEKWLELATSALRISNARAVNLSSGIFSSPVVAKALQKTVGFMKLIPSKTVKALASELERQNDHVQTAYSAINRSYKKFFEQNPNVVFVMAAGNSSEQTEKTSEWDLSKINDLPNLIQVAATDYQGEIANFSNRSSEHIEVAAPGIDLLGARFGGKLVRMSGTSMAAPPHNPPGGPYHLRGPR